MVDGKLKTYRLHTSSNATPGEFNNQLNGFYLQVWISFVKVSCYSESNWSDPINTILSCLSITGVGSLAARKFKFTGSLRKVL